MANIQVEKLSFAYENNPIFSEIDLQVKNKQFIGLIGPNGCGKSTLLKNVYKMHSPNGGDIYLNGTSINAYKSKDFAKLMSVVFQESNHQFDFSVAEIVQMGRYAHKKILDTGNNHDLKIVKNAIERVGLVDFENRSFLSLSGGEKQRVLIARALAQESKVIVLDEPTNHLDIKYQLQIMELLKSLRITTFAAIHDFNIAAQYCDYLYIMKDGAVYSHGKPEKVLNETMFKEVFEVQSHIQTNPYTNKLHVSFYI